MIRRPDPPNTGLITLIGDPIVTVPDPGIYGITINRFKKRESRFQKQSTNNDLLVRRKILPPAGFRLPSNLPPQ